MKPRRSTDVRLIIDKVFMTLNARAIELDIDESKLIDFKRARNILAPTLLRIRSIQSVDSFFGLE